MRYLALLLVSLVARRVSPQAAYPVCDLLGDLAWLAARGPRRAVESNLRRVLGSAGPPPQRMVRAVFRHGARAYYDTFRIPATPSPELERLVEAEGWEHLDAALAAGRGAILVGAHLGSVSLTGQLVALRGYPLVAVVEPLRPEALYRLMARVRGAGGARLLPLSPTVGRELIAALRRNEVVALIADRDVGQTGIRVPFFGESASLPSGPAVLSLRTGAPMLIAVALRQAAGRFRGVIEPPLEARRSGAFRQDVEAMTRRIAARFEYYIGQDPTQWTVFQPIWPDQPA